MSELMNKRSAAKFLAVSPGTLERLMRSDLPYIKIGDGKTGSVRFALDDLQKYIEKRRVSPARPGAAA